MVKFTSIKEYRQFHESPDEAFEETADLREQRLTNTIKNEVRGILLSVAGALIWGYGGYIPIFNAA